MLGVGTGYSREIRGVFTEYSWDIRMYRVCVGYVSGMYRECVERNGMREMKLTTMETTGAAINTLPRYEGDNSAHGWHGWARKRGRWINDNGDNIPRKSTSLRGAGYVYQQLKQQLLSTTHCAQNNTLRATREMGKQQWRQYCARINILERYAGD